MVDLGVLASRAAIGSFNLPPEDVAGHVDHVFFGCGYLSFPRFVQHSNIDDKAGRQGLFVTKQLTPFFITSSVLPSLEGVYLSRHVGLKVMLIVTVHYIMVDP